MARLFPDSRKTRVVFTSTAEEQFYQLCLELPDAWRVFYSCTLSAMEDKDGLKDNEMDFVLYHPRFGIVVVEVKGGRIRHSTESGRFYSVNRHGESFAIKDPFQQALTFKSRLLRFLRTHNIRVPISHAVCFPSVSEQDMPVSAGAAREIIIGRDGMKHLAETLGRIVKMSQPEQFLKFEDVGSELDKVLVGQNFTTRLFLRDYIDGHENRMKDVESIHETLITPIASSHRLAIEGEAGTGKTMLALLLAKHFRDQGRSVLLLSSNTLLNLFLQKEAGNGIKVESYPELAGSFGVNLLIAPQDYAGEKSDWVQYEAPDRLKQAIQRSERRYDVVICDEAQDVQPFWWEAIESLQNKDAEDYRFYLFFDRGQGVFGSGDGNFVAEEVLPIPAPYFPLVHNYRTTREIAGFARHFRTKQGTLQSHCGRIGYVPEIVIYKDADHAQKLLRELSQNLVTKEGLAPTDITLLSARNPAARESVLYQTDAIGQFPLHRLVSGRKKNWEEAATPTGAIGISTIAGFKGLETSVGILLNVSEYNMPVDNPIMASLIYVACTRAKHMLYIFIKEGDSKLEAFRQALANLSTSGTLIVGERRNDFEFSGTVTHYNPERVGWLKVDDPAFDQGSIMFFPHDVARSGLDQVTVGTKIKFRPRVEGHLTIACDLTLSQGAGVSADRRVG